MSNGGREAGGRQPQYSGACKKRGKLEEEGEREEETKKKIHHLTHAAVQGKRMHVQCGMQMIRSSNPPEPSRAAHLRILDSFTHSTTIGEPSCTQQYRPWSAALAPAAASAAANRTIPQPCAHHGSGGGGSSSDRSWCVSCSFRRREPPWPSTAVIAAADNEPI